MNISLGAGRANLALGTLALTSLNIDGGAGNIEGGVGQIILDGD